MTRVEGRCVFVWKIVLFTTKVAILGVRVYVIINTKYIDITLFPCSYFCPS